MEDLAPLESLNICRPVVEQRDSGEVSTTAPSAPSEALNQLEKETRHSCVVPEALRYDRKPRESEATIHQLSLNRSILRKQLWHRQR
jgi:hypothetical protein